MLSSACATLDGSRHLPPSDPHLTEQASPAPLHALSAHHSQIPTSKYGERLKDQVEERLRFYDSGEAPRKNIDVMKAVMDELRAEGKLGGGGDDEAAKKKAKKDKKEKRKSEAPEEGGEKKKRKSEEDDDGEKKKKKKKDKDK